MNGADKARARDQVRALVESGTSRRGIAVRLGVAQSTVQAVLAGEWDDLPDAINLADFQGRGACRSQDTELSFANRADRARAVCAGCPVMAICQAWALQQETDSLHGVWGGMTQNDRRMLKRRLNRRTA